MLLDLLLYCAFTAIHVSKPAHFSRGKGAHFSSKLDSVSIKISLSRYLD